MPIETHNSTEPSRSSRSANRQKRRPHKQSRRSPLGKPDLHQLSAGGIIYRKKAGQIEIFFIKDPFGRWTFPKGKPKLGETLAEAAVREIFEETGLDGLRLVSPLGRTSFRFLREEGIIEKTVYFFLFQAPLTAEAKFTGAEEIWEGAWMKLHKAFTVSGYRNVDQLLGKAMRIICEKEGLQLDGAIREERSPKKQFFTRNKKIPPRQTS